MRIAAILEYDGSRFSGWQSQDGRTTVQRCVEQALSKVADQPVRVTVAGRTDAGVHACAQVIHFDTSAARRDYSWVRGANSHLPREIALLWAAQVTPSFHARFSATGRRYDYVILNRPVRPTFLAARVAHEYRPLEIARMAQAASYLIGEHDFTSFRSSECEAPSPVRDLRALRIDRTGEFVKIHAYANAFLHHMVRNIAGVLITIGAGEREPRWAGEVLGARDRAEGGVTADADGLYLSAVEYPESFGIPRLSNPLTLW